MSPSRKIFSRLLRTMKLSASVNTSKWETSPPSHTLVGTN
jgi:hypothetical protein